MLSSLTITIALLFAPEPPSVTFYTMGCEPAEAAAIGRSLDGVADRAAREDVRLIVDDATWLCGYALFAGDRLFIDGPLSASALWDEIAAEFAL